MVVALWPKVIMSRAVVASLEALRTTWLFPKPLIPDRAIVQEVQILGEWYGNYH